MATKNSQPNDPFKLPVAEREQRRCKTEGHAFQQAGSGGYSGPALFGSDEAPMIVLFCTRCGVFKQRTVMS